MSCSRFRAEWERGELKDGLAGSGCQQDGLYMLMVRNPGHELTITGEEEVFVFLPRYLMQPKGISQFALGTNHAYIYA